MARFQESHQGLGGLLKAN